MWRFGPFTSRPRKNESGITDEGSGSRIVFLQQDPPTLVAGTMIPDHVHQPLSTIMIMKKRWIETVAVEWNGIGPFTLDVFGGDQMVVGIHETTAEISHIGEDQVKDTIAMAESRSPDSAGGRVPSHVQLVRASQSMPEQTPVDQITRVMNAYPGPPFKSRGGDVEIISHPDDGGIRIETWQNRILNRQCEPRADALNAHPTPRFETCPDRPVSRASPQGKKQMI